MIDKDHEYDAWTPHNCEAELSIIVHLISRRVTTLNVFQYLQKNDFYREDAGEFFFCMKERLEHDFEPVVPPIESFFDKNTIQNIFKLKMDFDKKEGTRDLMTEYHARIIKSCAQRRKLLVLADDIETTARNETVQIQMVFDIFRNEISRIEKMAVEED